ncbi:MAG: hypothetical protein ACRDRH_25705 [Pseudonocardia sp.]
MPLHRLSGNHPPEEFTVRAGSHTLPVMICKLDPLEWCAGAAGGRACRSSWWSPGPERAVIHYIGENGLRAAADPNPRVAARRGL